MLIPVFWCILGLVSFPKVCKKPPSYNNFQRKTTHPNHLSSRTLWSCGCCAKGFSWKRGEVSHTTHPWHLDALGGTTPNDVSVACETGNGSNVLSVSFWNRQKVMTMFGCHCLQHLDLLCTFFIMEIGLPSQGHISSKEIVENDKTFGVLF